MMIMMMMMMIIIIISLSGGDHRWFKRSTRQKRPVTRDIHIVL